MTDPLDATRPSAKPRLAVGWLTAGQLDAGFASLATFVAGLYAVRHLTPVGLGAYALLFAAFQVVNQFPSQLVFGPAEVLSISQDPSRRLGTLAWSLRLGSPAALIAGIGVWLGALPLFSDVPASIVVPLTFGAMGLAVVSPLQDHMRKMFHLAHDSWRAAQISAIHVTVTSASLLVIGGISDVWSVFGALALGNLASLAWGALFAARAHVAPWPRPQRQQLLGLGRWLLLVGLASTGFSYLAVAVLKLVAGVDAVGFAEGARVVAQPLNVVVLGLMAVFAPRSMEAASNGLAREAVGWRRRCLAVFAMVAVPYALFTSIEWPLNPMPGLLPNAYQVAGLVPAMIAAMIIHAASSPWRAELLGARLQASLGRSVFSSGVLELGMVGATAGLIGAFAAPLGLATGALFRWGSFAARLRRWYRAPRGDSRHVLEADLDSNQ